MHSKSFVHKTKDTSGICFTKFTNLKLFSTNFFFIKKKVFPGSAITRNLKTRDWKFKTTKANYKLHVLYTQYNGSMNLLSLPG